MASKYDALARIIIQNVGGKGNVNSVAHCVTRLRFKLKDESLANDEVLEKTDGVLKIIHGGGQYQVVIGPSVGDVYDTVLAIGGFAAGGLVDDDGNPIEDDSAPASKNPVDIAIDLISGIIQPVLPVLAAAGMTKGLLALFAYLGWMPSDSGAYKVIYAFADGFFYFLPIFLGITTARKFKMNEFVGGAIGASLCYPAMVGLLSLVKAPETTLGSILAGTAFEMKWATTFFGLPIIMPSSGYTTSVIPPILAVWAASIFWKWVDAKLPSAVRFFMSPMLTLWIFVPLTYLVIGPVAGLLTGILAWFFQTVATIPVVGGLLVGALLGGMWQVLVIFGLHWAVVPLLLNNLTINGYDTVFGGRQVCTHAQVATVLAICLKTKDERLRQMAIPSIVAGIFGTTEPAIYGVTLPKRKPFVISCIASAIGGAFVGAMGAKQFTMGYSGILMFLLYIDPSGAEGISNLIWMLLGTLIAVVIAFVTTWITYKDDDVAKA